MLFKSTDRFPGRLLKHLAAMGVIQEAGPDQYRRTGVYCVLVHGAIQRCFSSDVCQHIYTHKKKHD